MSSRLASLFLFAAIVCGCKPAVVTQVPELSGTRTWSMPVDGSGTPGLDGGTFYFIGSRFVVWAADGRGGGGGRTSSQHRGTNGDGFVMLKAGKQVRFQFDIPQGSNGKATIDGTEYDLSKGRLILVKPTGDTITVKQVDAYLGEAILPGSDLAAIGRANPDIQAFFEPAK